MLLLYIPDGWLLFKTYVSFIEWNTKGWKMNAKTDIYLFMPKYIYLYKY